MISKSQLDLFDPKGGRRGRCDGEFPQPFTNTGARAYAQVGRFEKVPPRTAPTAPYAPCEPIDPARNYPTPASIKAAFDRWDAEHAAWVAAGMNGDYPHPPAGLTSAIASRLIPRGNRGANQWRK
jgi:hypothetical protein